MFYQDYRKYYKGYHGKLNLNICFHLWADSSTHFVLYVDTTLNNCYNHFQPKSLSIRMHFLAINTQSDISYQNHIHGFLSY